MVRGRSSYYGTYIHTYIHTQQIQDQLQTQVHIIPSLHTYIIVYIDTHLETAVGFWCSLGGGDDVELEWTSSENLGMLSPGEQTGTSTSVERI